MGDLASTFRRDVLLRDYSTFKVGGPARYFTEVADLTQVQEIVAYCSQQQIPFFVLGKGSNCLFDDRGFNGLVILNKLDKLTESDGLFTVGAGYSFSHLGVVTARQGWAGLEFASGIPGSVGGAVFMNAGANQGETAAALERVIFVDATGTVRDYARNDLTFSYRHSLFQELAGVIVEASFRLMPDLEARQRQIKIIDYRKATQPLRDKSAGCVFRNPDGGFAGQLIESCQLKGIAVGGAQVSPRHANFIVNAGGATAQDVLGLMAKVKEAVYQQTGKVLHEEIRYVRYLPS